MKNAPPIHRWPIAKVSGLSLACQYDNGDLCVVYAHDNDVEAVQTDMLSACIDVWRLVGRPFSLRHLVFKDDERAFVVSGHGDLAFQGFPSVNLGLLFRSLSDLPFNLPFTSPEEPKFGNEADRVIWRILARLARCETPRRLEVEIGEYRVEIDATANAFNIVSGVKDLQELIDLIRVGATAATPLRYTLGDPASDISQRYTINDVLVVLGGRESDETDRWQIAPKTWPERIPANARFDGLQAAMLLTSLGLNDLANDGKISFQGYDEKRAVVLKGEVEEDGTLKLITTL